MKFSSRVVNIVPLNESYVRLECEESIAREAKNYFTFQVPGYQFSPKYKAKLWDGRIRLIDASGKLYRGLVPRIQKWAAEQNYTIEWDEPDGQVDHDELESYIKNIKFPFEPRDYQINTFIEAIQKKRALFLSPTSSGKAAIIYAIFSYLHSKQYSKRTLILVPTTALVMQLTTDFADYGYDIDSNVHQLFDGATKKTDKPVIVSNWQSIQNMPRKWFEQFDCIIGDEAHGCKAKSLTYIISSCINAKYRFGLTGTIDDLKVHQLILEGLFGSLYKATTTAELMARGEVVQFEIKALVIKYGASEARLVSKMKYPEEIDWICAHEGRNKLITNLAVTRTSNTLVLFQYIEKHGDIIYKMIKDAAGPNRKVFYVHGAHEAEDRNTIRGIVETEKNAIIVASVGVFSTGINIKNLHNVIFTSPSKAKIKTLQSIGRVLRLHKDKNKAVLFDIVDNLKYKDRPNYTLNHFNERLKIYASEKFKFKIYNIEMKA